MDTEMDPQAHFNQWRESQRPEQRWPSVEVSEIVCAALSQKGKAMGTGGAGPRLLCSPSVCGMTS